MKAIGKLAVILAGFALIAAACGSDDASTTTAGAGTETTAASETTTTAMSETTAAAETTTAATDAMEPIVIGLSLQNQARSFFTGMVAGAQEKADELGVDLRVVEAADDSEKQTQDVADLIQAGVAGILLSPVDSAVAVSIADNAIQAGVPILAVANQIGTVDEYGPQYVYPGTVALVTNDDIDMGAKAAGFVKELAAGNAVKIAIVSGSTGTANATLRDKGFKDELDALGVSYEIVAEQDGAWTNEQGEVVCQNLLQANPAGTLDIIFSHSDEMSAGCARALDSADRVGDVSLVSIGGNEKGIGLLNDGLMVGTVCQKPGTMGATAVETMYNAITTGNMDQGLTFYETPVVTLDTLDLCVPQW
jgi:ribose transport system substrate-binding protein